MLGVIGVASFGLVVLSMWLFWTPLNSKYIEGLQGRYFIPLFVPLCVCFFTKQKKSRFTKKVIYRTAFGTMIYMNLYMFTY